MYTGRRGNQETSRLLDSSTLHARVRERMARTNRAPDVLLLEPGAAPPGLSFCPRCRGIPLGRFLGTMPPGNCPMCWHSRGRTTPLTNPQPEAVP
jgi:hypothetical protein